MSRFEQDGRCTGHLKSVSYTVGIEGIVIPSDLSRNLFLQHFVHGYYELHAKGTHWGNASDFVMCRCQKGYCSRFRGIAHVKYLSLIHISEPTRRTPISY